MRHADIVEAQKASPAGRAVILVFSGLAAAGIAVEAWHQNTAAMTAREALRSAAMAAAAGVSDGHSTDRAFDRAAVRFRDECGQVCGQVSLPNFSQHGPEIVASFTFFVDTKIIKVFGKKEMEVSVETSAPVTPAGSDSDPGEYDL
jgi:hypothetical protein